MSCDNASISRLKSQAVLCASEKKKSVDDKPKIKNSTNLDVMFEKL